MHNSATTWQVVPFWGMNWEAPALFTTSSRIVHDEFTNVCPSVSTLTRTGTTSLRIVYALPALARRVCTIRTVSCRLGHAIASSSLDGCLWLSSGSCCVSKKTSTLDMDDWGMISLGGLCLWPVGFWPSLLCSSSCLLCFRHVVSVV